MQIYPAIDIKNGRAVRLVQGLADNVTDYGAPVNAGPPPGGGRLHSGWFIFCCIFFCTMLAAAIAQAIYGRVKKARAKKEG